MCLSAGLDSHVITFPFARNLLITHQIIYRLTKCGELCFGIFCTVIPGSGGDIESLGVGRPVETDREDGGISVLLGHVISTKTSTPVVTDASMDIPRDWQSEHPAPSEVGHDEDGRTIVLHSVAVAPQVQGRGLGRVLVLAYMQHMNGAGIADRLVLIAHDVSSFVLSYLFSYSNISYSIWFYGTKD
jgi:GNAT superfamily N-acetyltransferase